ncbi:SF0329 family protein [Dethiothermospora halolimnae]|uniref:SF0329 family protein n=1 Tax=Dethiothermospora halolimnae TaxID=3114390 RepID=UPI003CCC0AE5
MWTKTKKRLENFICDSLKGRVEFHCSNYRIHDGIGRTYITVDGIEVYNMCTLKRDYYSNPKKGLISQVEFMKSVEKYFLSPIDKCLESKDTAMKILVVLDKRIGKRRLKKMKGKINNETDIIKYFYKLRCDAEGLD